MIPPLGSATHCQVYGQYSQTLGLIQAKISKICAFCTLRKWPIDPQRRQTVTDMLEAQEVCRSAKGKIDVPIVERLLRFKP